MGDGSRKRVELYVDFLYSGMVLKGDLFNEAGEKIPLANHKVTEGILTELKNKNYKKVYYEKPIELNEGHSEPMLAPEEINKAIDVHQNLVDSVLKKTKIPEAAVTDIVNSFADKIRINDSSAVLNLLELQNLDSYTYSHSINVAMLAILFAKLMGYNDELVRLLGIGGMLHDIGKTLVPREIIEKPARLTDDEFAIMKKHTVFGYEIIKSQTSYPEAIQQIALLHHESYNGSGYPFGLSAEKVDDLSYLVAICDFYDASTSKKSYKDEYPPWYSFIVLQKLIGSRFHPRLGVDFINKMPELVLGKPIFDIGQFVVLSTNEIGMVVEMGKVESLKPIVSVFVNERKEILKYPLQIRLEIDPHRRIEKIIEEPAMVAKLRSFMDATYTKKA